VQSLSTIRALLDDRGLRPKHRLGQNFLHDQNQIRKLLAAAGVASGDLVLEVGPGTGALTEALVDAGAEVIASELDDDMANIVADRLALRVTLIRGDCLEGKRALAPAVRTALAGRPFLLIANLPYGAATPLMATLLVSHPECRGQFVTVQREVADRLAAAPGTKTCGSLSVIAQSLATVEVISILPGSCFWPAPEVTSAMIAIRPFVPRPTHDAESLANFVGMLFQRRRKQLGSILGRTLAWPEGIQATMRPESLTPAQAIALQAAVEGMRNEE